MGAATCEVGTCRQRRGGREEEAQSQTEEISLAGGEHGGVIKLWRSNGDQINEWRGQGGVWRCGSSSTLYRLPAYLTSSLALSS